MPKKRSLGGTKRGQSLDFQNSWLLTHYQITASGVEHVLLAGLDLSSLVGPEEGGQAAIVAQQVKTFRQFGRNFAFRDLIY
jgi:hypothetical protein